MANGTRPITKHFVDNYEFDTVLDVGCGKGHLWPELKGKDVTGVDIKPRKGKRKIQADFMEWDPPKTFDAVMCSHVVEHMPDTARFLTRLLGCVPEDGPFCIIWPPYKPFIVGGHVHVFNFGLILYNLVRLGFDCQEAKLAKCAYSEAVMGRKKTFEVPKLRHDRGDIKTLAPWFPFPAVQGFDGLLVPGVVRLKDPGAEEGQ